MDHRVVVIALLFTGLLVTALVTKDDVKTSIKMLGGSFSFEATQKK